MKQHITLALVALAILVVASSCHKSDLPGFKKTESGLHYKFIKENKKAQQVQMEDALVCEVILTLEHDTLFNNMGNPQRLMQATDAQFYGSIEEGLLMLHKGDEAVFAVEADSVAKYHNMPANYKAGKSQKMYYTIKLDDIVTAASLAKAESLFLDDMNKRQEAEPQTIAAYISSNNIKVAPNADGLYIITNKKGSGAKIKAGSHVTFNYTGRLMDSTVFVSNVQSVAQNAGIYNSQRTYKPEEFIMGEASYVKGLLEGMEGLSQGANVTLIIPSSLGYGSEGMGEKIPPYTPIIFDVEIVSVK
jgi:FKBP-type peptidyl-prolyl cis-trans isomerase